MDKRDLKDMEYIRETLRKAADIQSPRDMWYVLHDLLNLLTMIVAPFPIPGQSQDPSEKGSTS